MAKRPTPGRDDKICVAQIGAPHGLRGEVRLFSFTQNPADVAAYGPLASEDGTRRFTLASLRPARDHFVVTFEGVNDRNAAEMLRNIKLYIGRDKLPASDEADSYYHTDLLGLTAVYPNGDVLGQIVAVHNFGAGDLLEIARPEGGNTVLLPFTDQIVPSVDIAAQQIVVDPPEGALDATAPADDMPGDPDAPAAPKAG